MFAAQCYVETQQHADARPEELHDGFHLNAFISQHALGSLVYRATDFSCNYPQPDPEAFGS